ncbi:hypothetical protein V1460_03170 [Streptomyces sp. SCSIO 30461]|uniref:hypothetical protein n=1 Tax=Streptomyces sp. SCSIO 30461 TaxID=3118085 RepID=UPI0030D1E36E
MIEQDEYEIRQGLRELAEADGTGGAAPVAAVVARARRVRHRRRSLAAGAATMLVAAGVVVGTGWKPVGTDNGAPIAGPSIAASVRGPSGDELASRVTPGWGDRPPQPPSADGGPLDTGPRKAEDGVRYRYDLSRACGLEYAVFGGRVWQAEQASSALSWDADADRMRGFIRWETGINDRAEPDLAIFEADMPNADTTEIIFRPAPGTAKPECLDREPERRHSEAFAATVGPRDPEPGVRYVYDWNSVCGANYIVFGGGLWKSDDLGGPKAFALLTNDRPGPAFIKLSEDRETAVVEGARINAQDKQVLKEGGYAYHRVDDFEAGDLKRCRDGLEALRRIAREGTP